MTKPMKLYCSTTSPFARKCRITLVVTQLNEQTDMVLTNVFDDPEFRKTNPLGKVPALTDGDLTLVDSPLICEYLDHKSVQAGNKSLFKTGTEQYFPTQVMHVQANGILDAAVSAVMEKRRDTEQSTFWIERWEKAIEASVKNVETKALIDAEDLNIATIAWATALGYLDFRHSHLNWRQWDADLAHWFSQIEQLDWFSDTLPG